jgi:hypothetical protein
MNETKDIFDTYTGRYLNAQIRALSAVVDSPTKYTHTQIKPGGMVGNSYRWNDDERLAFAIIIFTPGRESGITVDPANDLRIKWSIE